jgi:hypothetical protein
MDSLANVGLLDVEEADGKKQYKPKAAAAPGTPAPKPGPQRAEEDPLFQRVKTLESQLEKARREKEDSDKAVAAQARDTAIIESLRNAGAVNPQRDFMHLREKVQKGDSGYFATGKDEAGYDVEVKLDDLAKEFLKTNPELRKATTGGGAGSPNGGQGGGQQQVRPGQTVIPKSQWTNMDFFMANKRKFDTGEYVRGQQ